MNEPVLFDQFGNPISKLKNDEVCSHPRACPNGFDAVAAKGLDAYEVRRRWPRGNKCPDCGVAAIFYVSYEHFISGDW